MNLSLSLSLKALVWLNWGKDNEGDFLCIVQTASGAKNVSHQLSVNRNPYFDQNSND